MIELDFIGLRTFLTVCEKQSLTEAARALGTTQSAVSQRLKKLEEQTKLRLLDRQLRPVGPTPAGQALLERARHILAEVGQLEFELSGRPEMLLRELRLGIADSLGSAIVPSLVRALRPSVERLAVRVDGSVDLGRLLIERELHAVISSDPLLERDDVDRFELYNEPMVLILPPKYPYDVARGVETLRHLAGTMPFIRYSPVSPLARQIEIHLRRLGLQPPRNLEFNESETVAEMVRNGLGWSISTPLCLLQARAISTDLGIHRLPAGAMRRDFSLLCRSNELGSLPRTLCQLSCTLIEERVVEPITSALPWLASELTTAPARSFAMPPADLKASIAH